MVDQTLNYCGDPAIGGAQCWYDNVVYSPPGKPDVVYLGGSYTYSRYGLRNNGRAFVRSADAGVHFTDMTWDATTNPAPAGSCCQPNAIAPNGMHPDSHAIVGDPGDRFSDLWIGRWTGSLQWSVFGHLFSVFFPWPRCGKSCVVPADAFRGTVISLQPEQRTVDFTVPEFCQLLLTIPSIVPGRHAG